MERLDYFFKRLLLIIPTFIGITVLCFLLIQFVPGGPVEQAIMQMKGIGSGEISTVAGSAQSITERQRKQIEAYYGFDQPFYKQYIRWIKEVSSGHLGYSIVASSSVWEAFWRYFEIFQQANPVHIGPNCLVRNATPRMHRQRQRRTRTSMSRATPNQKTWPAELHDGP